MNCISNYAFSGLKKLNYAYIADTVDDIGDRVFEQDYSLRNVRLPENSPRLGEGIFSYCQSLDNVKIPNLIILPKNTFEYCHSLKNVSLPDGLAIIDTMNYVNADVATNVGGLAASMAAVISSSGHPGKRYILPHSRFMIHQPSHGSGGGYEQASDMEIKVKEINRLKSELYTILTENSQLTYEEIEKMSDRDHWLTAQEAIKYGFMDEIITNKKSPTNG